jgi:hypothetical protein
VDRRHSQRRGSCALAFDTLCSFQGAGALAFRVPTAQAQLRCMSPGRLSVAFHGGHVGAPQPVPYRRVTRPIRVPLRVAAVNQPRRSVSADLRPVVGPIFREPPWVVLFPTLTMAQVFPGPAHGLSWARAAAPAVPWRSRPRGPSPRDRDRLPADGLDRHRTLTGPQPGEPPPAHLQHPAGEVTHGEFGGGVV